MTVSAATTRSGAEVALVMAFTTDGTGGNLAGVVLDAAGFSTAERQRIAAVVGAAETAFVSDLGDGVFDVTFFTPTKQVPDCGHATVATFALLAQQGALPSGKPILKRTIAGDRAITLEGEAVYMQQLRPALTPLARTAELAAALGLTVDDFVAEPVIADNGVRFVQVRVLSRALLASVVPNGALEAISDAVDAIGFYVTAPGDDGYDATARMFAPRYGIPEESATGMAAGLFGGVLADGRERARYRVEQGALMTPPSRSTLNVRVEPDRVLVGGTATVLRTMRVEPQPA